MADTDDQCEAYSLQSSQQPEEPARSVSDRTWGRVDIKNSQNSDKGKQTEAQTEDRLQANGEREVDVGVDVNQTGAPAATLGLVCVETDRYFLEDNVSQVES